MNIEEAITLLSANGYSVADIRLQQHYREAANWYEPPIPDSFLVASEEETTDLYFDSFQDGGLKAPPFSFRNLAVGRCFTLTRGQLQVLRDRFGIPTSDQVTIRDLGKNSKGRVNYIKFYFASRGKSAVLALTSHELLDWWTSSQRLDEQFDKATAEREAKKPAVKRGSSLDKLADKWLNSEFGLGI